jgi:hypothetical protein
MDPRPPQKTFWSSVTWPKQEGLPIFVGGAVGFLVLGRLYAGWTYGLFSVLVMLPVFAALWALHRVVKAWAEWPSRRRWVGWLKRAVCFLLIDRAPERNKAFGPSEVDADLRSALPRPGPSAAPDPTSVQDAAARSNTPRQNAGRPSHAD